MVEIPDDAEKVFKGVFFDVYHWKQKMFDNSFEKFEALKGPNFVQVIAIKGNKLLMAKGNQPSEPNFYSLFKGIIEKGEKPLEAAKREFREESGYESSDWELLKKYNAKGKIKWDNYIFLAKNCFKAGEQNLDSGEDIKVIAIKFEEFLEIVAGDDFWGEEIGHFILGKMKTEKEKEEFKRKLFD